MSGESEKDETQEVKTDVMSMIVSELLYNPINLALFAGCLFLLYQIIPQRKRPSKSPSNENSLARLKKQDFTLEQLKQYDGHGKDGRVLIAVNGKVFDVSSAKRFYGPGGPYSMYAGKDASRGLATFSLDAVSDVPDDLSDLNVMEMESVREWELQFNEKYPFVGRLLKPGEQPNEYSEDEDPPESKEEDKSSETRSKDD